MVGVVQLVEHLVVVQDVAGSSPVTHPMSGTGFCAALFISKNRSFSTYFSQQTEIQLAHKCSLVCTFVQMVN